jgi:hypothetical protein
VPVQAGTTAEDVRTVVHAHRSPPTRDDAAVERYRHLLRSAAPEHLEEAHADAFARLTPAQRRQVRATLADVVPAAEGGPAGDDPRSLARLATRAEHRRPGTLERLLDDAGPARAAVGDLLDLGG